MRVDIVNFLRETCERLNLSANYQVTKDLYVVHKRGYPIQSFTTEQFYQLPKPFRRQRLLAILQRGLTYNLGEKTVKDNLYIHKQHGIRIA